MISALQTRQTATAQNTKISFDEIKVTLDNATANGNGVSFDFKEGKTSEYFSLYVSDTLNIKVAYRLNAYNSRRSQTKDSSLRLHVFYKCNYKGNEKELKAERMFFLNDKFQFQETASFNINQSKYSNKQIKITYRGTIDQN